MEKPVTTIEEIKDNINTFNEGKGTKRDVIQRNFQYWVYDTGTSQFAPGKFVQYCVGMTFRLYDQLAETNRARNVTQLRRRIEDITGEQFTENAHLRNELENWADELDIDLSGVNKEKWRFLEL